MLRKELDIYAKGIRLTNYHVLEKADNNWNYGKGYITEKIVKEQFGAPSKDTIVLLCGGGPFIKNVTLPILKRLGFNNIARF